MPEIGFKFHMNDVNALVGMANLAHLPPILERCRSNAAFYNAQLVQLPGVMLLDPLPAGTQSAWWLYTIRVPAAWRARFFAHMKGRGVMVSAVHQRNDIHSCVARFGTLLPQLNVLAEEVACLPVGWWVTDAMRERVVDAVKTYSAIYLASCTATISRRRNPPPWPCALSTKTSAGALMRLLRVSLMSFFLR